MTTDNPEGYTHFATAPVLDVPGTLIDIDDEKYLYLPHVDGLGRRLEVMDIASGVGVDLGWELRQYDYAATGGNILDPYAAFGVTPLRVQPSATGEGSVLSLFTAISAALAAGAGLKDVVDDLGGYDVVYPGADDVLAVLDNTSSPVRRTVREALAQATESIPIGIDTDGSQIWFDPADGSVFNDGDRAYALI